MRALMATLAVTSFMQAVPAAAESPIVVELYTSQGCSSCPPADAFLHDLAESDNIIALALHVDYWDYIGWKDSFAAPQFTARQHAYAQAANATTVYTPQMVIHGEDHVVGSRPVQVMDRVEKQRAQGSPVDVVLNRNGDNIQIEAEAQQAGDYVLQVVRYIPKETVSIRRGENAGKELSYAHIVKSWEVVGRWDGSEALTLSTVAMGPEPVVVIVQESANGPIVGAAELR